MCVIIHKPANKRVSKRNLKKCWSRNEDGAGLMYVEGGKLKVEKGIMTFREFFKRYEKHKTKNLVMHMRLASAGLVSKDNTHPFFVDEDLAMCHNGTIQTDFVKNESDKYLIKLKIKKLQKKAKKASKIKKAKKTSIEPLIDLSKLFNDKKAVTASEWIDAADKLEEELDEIIGDAGDEEDDTPTKNNVVCSVSDTKIFNDEILQKLPKGFLNNPVLREMVKQYADGSCLVFLNSENKVTILGSFGDPIKIDGCWFSNDSWKINYSMSSYVPKYITSNYTFPKSYTVGGVETPYSKSEDDYSYLSKE